MSFIDSLPPELICQILVHSCEDRRSYDVRDYLDVISHREIIGSVCRGWRDLVISTPRLWSLFYIWKSYNEADDVSNEADQWRRWLNRSGSVPLKIYINNPSQALLIKAWEVLAPAFHRVSVLELHLDSFHWVEPEALWSIPSLPEMPSLRRLYMHGRFDGYDTFKDLMNMDNNIAGQTTLLRQLIVRDVSITPSTTFPLQHLMSLQLGYQDDIRATWGEISPLLSLCTSLLHLSLTFSNANRFVGELHQASETVSLPKLEAIEVDNDKVLSLIIAPNVRCLCRSRSQLLMRAAKPFPSLRYLRIPTPRDFSDQPSGWQRSLIDIASEVGVVELRGDDYTDVFTFLDSLLIDRLRPETVEETLSQRYAFNIELLPRLQVLIIRRAVGYTHGHPVNRRTRTAQFYALAMEVLRHRPWLLIHNAELYQCIHSNELWEQAWATTSDAESPDEDDPFSPSGAKSLAMPERIPLLESRIKNIPRDVRKPRPPGRIRSIAEKLSEEYVHLSNS